MPRKRAPTTAEALALWRDHGIRMRRLSPAEAAALDRIGRAPKRKSEDVPLEVVNARLKARPFEPHREPAAPTAVALVQHVQALVAEHDARLGVRTRARRGTVQAAFEATVSALVCDLAHQHLGDAGGTLAVSRRVADLGKAKGRYDAAHITAAFPRTLDLMEGAGFLAQHEGNWHYGTVGKKSFKTVIEPGPSLLAALERHPGLTSADFTLGEGRETIILRHSRNHPNPRLKGQKVDYDDTPETIRMREEMTTLNEWWAGADLSIAPGHTPAAPVNLSRRTMSRIFSATDPTFGKGGRLYHGFWVDMAQKDRAALLIGGEPVVSLDFGSAFIRMAYGRAETELPSGDPYAIGRLGEWPRSIVKRLVNAALDDRTLLDVPSAAFGLRAWPSDVQALMKDEWPDRPPLREVRAAIETAHAPIRHLMYRGVGLELQALESRIMVAVLLALRFMGVVGLPVHDCLIVPSRYEAAVRDLMSTEFRAKANATAEIHRA